MIRSIKLDCLIPVSARMQVRDTTPMFHYCHYLCVRDSFHLLRAGIVMWNMKKWRCYPCWSKLRPGCCLVPWTVFQGDPTKSFEDLFSTIASGGVRVIAPSGELVEATLERVFADPYKESLSVVDCTVFVVDVCKLFGQFIRYDVVQSKRIHPFHFFQVSITSAMLVR